MYCLKKTSFKGRDVKDHVPKRLSLYNTAISPNPNPQNSISLFLLQKLNMNQKSFYGRMESLPSNRTGEQKAWKNSKE